MIPYSDLQRNYPLSIKNKRRNQSLIAKIILFNNAKMQIIFI